MFETYKTARDRAIAWAVILLMLWGGSAAIFYVASEEKDIAAVPLAWAIILTLIYPFVIAQWLKMRKYR